MGGLRRCRPLALSTTPTPTHNEHHAWGVAVRALGQLDHTASSLSCAHPHAFRARAGRLDRRALARATLQHLPHKGARAEHVYSWTTTKSPIFTATPTGTSFKATSFRPASTSRCSRRRREQRQRRLVIRTPRSATPTSARSTVRLATTFPPRQDHGDVDALITELIARAASARHVGGGGHARIANVQKTATGATQPRPCDVTSLGGRRRAMVNDDTLSNIRRTATDHA